MAIRREKEATKTVVLDDKKKPAEEKKVKTKKEEPLKEKKDRFLSPKGIVEEWKKITWPTGKKILKDTVIILVFLVLTAIGIALADLFIFKVILSFTETSPTQETLIKASAAAVGCAIVWVLVYVALKDRTKKTSN